MESKAKLLIVDDTPSGRQVLEVLLLDEPYELHFAASGQETLDVLPALQPHLVLMDVMMPGLDGYDTCRMIRANPHLAELPVLLITALDDPESRLEGLDSGADEFISKPFNSVELRTRIRNIIQLNRFQKLQAERLRYSGLFSASPDGIFITNLSGEILVANEEAARILDVPFPDRAQGIGLASVVAESSRASFLALLESACEQVRAGAPPAELELISLRGEARLVEVSHLAVNWGGAPALQLIARDVTESRQMEEQFQHAQKMEAVGQLAVGVAHDFGNVLTIINGYSAYLLASVEDDSPLRRSIQGIADASERASHLASQVMFFSRKEPYAPRDLDLNAQLREVKPMLGRLLGDAVTLKLDLDPGLGLVRVDASQMEQVILNLAVNSRDAMGAAGGELTFRTANAAVAPDGSAPPTSTGYVTLCVADTGCGMDEATRDRIFEPFFTTKSHKGTGLGLPNVQRILKRHQGHIHVDSAPDQGTAITIYLPRTPGGARGT